MPKTFASHQILVVPIPASKRCDLPEERNLTHHLWRNGRFWWIHFTVLFAGYRQERIRFSLRTPDLAEARRRRDLCSDGMAA